ncbi:hypothetical protein D3C75_1264710 [compost metagenome]
MTEQLTAAITPSSNLKILPAIIEGLALVLRQLADHFRLDDVCGQKIETAIVQHGKNPKRRLLAWRGHHN